MLVEALSHGFVAGIRDVPYASTWSNVLRLLPAPANELPRRACTSKRAMVSMLKSAERFGFVVVDDGIAHLTDAGRAVDPGWGPAGCEPLAALVSQLELEHPHHVVPYGTADGSMTGGPGVDWKPVPRQSSDVAGLPMTALLSQALTAFAIEYERDHIGPISWAANLLPQLVDDGVPFVSKPGTHTLKNMARVGVVSVEGSWARPTPLGVRCAMRTRRCVPESRSTGASGTGRR